MHNPGRRNMSDLGAETGEPEAPDCQDKQLGNDYIII